MHIISPLKTFFDEIDETNSEEKCQGWLGKVFNAKLELAIFVASRRLGPGVAKKVRFSI